MSWILRARGSPYTPRALNLCYKRTKYILVSSEEEEKDSVDELA